MSRVIIIDDEPDWVDVLKEYLEMKDIEVLATGNNGQDAIELCKLHPVDVLILDLSMPEYDGFYALEHISRLKIPVKIIILTGMLSESHKERLDKFELTSILIKPINPQLIVEEILD